MKWIAKLDKRGRLTLPKSLRDSFSIQTNDDFDFAVSAGLLVMFRKSDGLAFTLQSPKQDTAK
jgi:bifunctional DNA-binding transcriptional regulator/antitoxin component of YhaV-PrlF toxin-antitoxin module